MSNTIAELEKFIQEWQENAESIKGIFVHFKNLLESLDNTEFEFVVREGLTFSLRVKHPQQQKIPLFAMIDVIEGEPRWLSICFYAEMITDPEELGDFVPGGLLGEDAFCFDVADNENNLIDYLTYRLQEAYVFVSA